MVGVTVMLILLTTAAQSWTFRMRREMEFELKFRGQQYINALSAYRNQNGGAFPVGDLKVLEQKSPMGVRFIRKLYTNPFDPNGKWQYLYLHPGGAGFVNPCATGPAIPGTLGASNNAGGGFPVGGSIPAGAFSPLPNSGGSRFGNRGGRSGRGMMPGQAGQFGMPGQVGLPGQVAMPGGSALPGGIGGSAIDPETFNQLGGAKLNLPIVGVVDCEVKESIGVYMGQTWLNQWAFTPLAQGKFVNTVPTSGGSNWNIAMPKGLGMKGAEVIRREDKKDSTYTGDGRVDDVNRRNQQMRDRRINGSSGSWNRDRNQDDGKKGGKKVKGGSSGDNGDDYYDDDYDDDYDDNYDDPYYDDDSEDEGEDGSSGGGLNASAP